MWEKIKSLLGIKAAELVLSLEERKAEAKLLAADALSAFDRIVEDLEEAAGTLTDLAVEAEEKIVALIAEKEDAISEAGKNAQRAAKIRELLA